MHLRFGFRISESFLKGFLIKSDTLSMIIPGILNRNTFKFIINVYFYLSFTRIFRFSANKPRIDSIKALRKKVNMLILLSFHALLLWILVENINTNIFRADITRNQNYIDVSRL